MSSTSFLHQLQSIKNKISNKITSFIETIKYCEELKSLSNQTSNSLQKEKLSIETIFKEQETKYDKLYESFLRSNSIVELYDSILSLFKNFESLSSPFISFHESEKETIGNEINALLDEMKSTEDHIQIVSDERKLHNYTEWKIETNAFIENESNSLKEIQLSEAKKQREREKQLDSENRLLRYATFKKQHKIEEWQSDQFEEWTWLKVQDVLFDSTKQNWKTNNSVFIKQIIGKSNLLFVIEDSEKNIFGYFQSKQFEEIYNTWIPSDDKSFVFSLQSNNRIEYPIKCEILNTTNGYKLFDESDNRLIAFGSNAILLRKYEMRKQSYCDQKNDLFNYHNISSVLIGKEYPNWLFKPKRILVIQMK